MTIVFWCIAAMMLILALLFVLPPLLRRAEPLGTDAGDELNITVHRARLSELEEQFALGSLSEEQFRLARDELQRALLEDVSTPKATTPRSAGTRRWVAAGTVGLAIPLSSVVIYALVGSPVSPRPPGTDTPGPGDQPLEQMVETLRSRLAREPEDGEGWILLARSYTVLEKPQEALTAYARAYELLGDQAQLLVEYAQALAEHQGGQLTGRPADMLERALSLEPMHQRARWLAGFAALQSGHTARALAHWNALLAQLPAESEEARMVREISARISSGQAASDDGAGSTPEPAPGIDVRVSLDDTLALDANPSDTVFVFARAVGGTSRAPLAIARLRVADLPQTVRLDDSLSMIPERKLSDFDQVVIGARVSRTGQPIAQPGDMQGLSGPVSVVAGQPVDIVISSRVTGND